MKELGDTFDALLGRLEQSSEAQRQFVANASHELRTPLARQRTLIEVALRDPEPTVGTLRATYERVLAAGEQPERLIEALLTLARAGRGLERTQSLDLATLTDEVLIAYRPEIAARGLMLETALEFAPTSGASGLLERLIANLVDNAQRHNVSHGHIEVSTGMRAGRAVLAVTNSGPVIQLDEVGRLFEPFQRRGADRARHDKGIGLGLSIVKAIADAHGAGLSAQAMPSGGLHVEMAFPQAPTTTLSALTPGL